MSDGTPNPATWPMWRNPLAYGQATATRIFLREGAPLTADNHRQSISQSQDACRPAEEADREQGEQPEDAETRGRSRLLMTTGKSSSGSGEHDVVL